MFSQASSASIVCFLKHHLNSKGISGKLESSNVSRDNVSREIGHRWTPSSGSIIALLMVTIIMMTIHNTLTIIAMMIVILMISLIIVIMILLLLLLLLIVIQTNNDSSNSGRWTPSNGSTTASWASLTRCSCRELRENSTSRTRLLLLLLLLPLLLLIIIKMILIMIITCMHIYIYIYIYIYYTYMYSSSPRPRGRVFIGKGQMGSALMASLQVSCFLTEGLLVGFSRSPTFIFPKCQGVPFSPILSNSLLLLRRPQ